MPPRAQAPRPLLAKAMPESNVRQHYQVLLGLIRRTCNFTVAVIWLYQGLVLKLLGPHSDELAMSDAFGVPPEWQASVSYAAGVGEVLLGICILRRSRYLSKP